MYANVVVIKSIKKSKTTQQVHDIARIFFFWETFRLCAFDLWLCSEMKHNVLFYSVNKIMLISTPKFKSVREYTHLHSLTNRLAFTKSRDRSFLIFYK